MKRFHISGRAIFADGSIYKINWRHVRAKSIESARERIKRATPTAKWEVLVITEEKEAGK